MTLLARIVNVIGDALAWLVVRLDRLADRVADRIRRGRG